MDALTPTFESSLKPFQPHGEYQQVGRRLMRVHNPNVEGCACETMSVHCWQEKCGMCMWDEAKKAKGGKG